MALGQFEHVKIKEPEELSRGDRVPDTALTEARAKHLRLETTIPADTM